MFIVQPNNNFGHLICEELNSEAAGRRKWQTFEFAVAWVNRPGAERIMNSARGFLAAGGSIHGTVGLDFSSTSYEGLSLLLDLEEDTANLATHVFYDENRSCTFHPKVFLFRNTTEACLLVGSNNMTGAGLDTNVEAALGVIGTPDDETFRDALQVLASWRSVENESRTKRLTRELLDQLRDQGYVRTEAEIRDDRRQSEARTPTSRREPLFGRSTTQTRRSADEADDHTPGVIHTPVIGSGEVLLMRVRPRRNGSQVQISMKVLEASFMNGALEVVSTDGSTKEIGYNEANGIRNTARFEAPEMMGMTNPVARFQWVESGVREGANQRFLQYEIFDADSGGEGLRILERLRAGITTPAVTDMERLSREITVLSKLNDAIAQWYRLDSV